MLCRGNFPEARAREGMMICKKLRTCKVDDRSLMDQDGPHFRSPRLSRMTKRARDRIFHCRYGHRMCQFPLSAAFQRSRDASPGLVGMPEKRECSRNIPFFRSYPRSLRPFKIQAIVLKTPGRCHILMHGCYG